MSQSSISKPAVFGFLGVVYVPGLGYCGGYLLLNSLGRPLEFHCTAPVSENRAQQILYGETYEPFIYCDQIGEALLDKAGKSADLIFVNDNRFEKLDVGVVPIVQVGSDGEPDPSHDGETSHHRIQIGGQTLVWRGPAVDRKRVSSACQCLARSIPLDEPFERISQAIDEAQAVVR